MRKLLGVVCAAATLALAAPASAATSPVMLTGPQIDAALVTIHDVPDAAADGLSLPPGSNGRPEPALTDGVCDGPNVASNAQSAGFVGFGGAFFRNTRTNGPFLNAVIFAFPSVGAAKKFMKSTVEQGKSCHNAWMASATGNAGDVAAPIPWKQQVVSMGKLGDQTYATHLTGDPTAIKSGKVSGSASKREVDTVYVRAQNYVIVTERRGSENVMDGSTENVGTVAKAGTARLTAALKKAAK
jgi:hypothetical protein